VINGMTHGHVYLIDNDHGRRATLVAALEGLQHKLEVFDDAPTFLNQIDYDRLPSGACVLTHLSLKPISGLELLDVFRADRVTLPTILIGTTAELSLGVRALRYGTSYVLWRPFTAALLMDVVSNVLREWSAPPAAPVASVDQDNLRSLEDRFSSLSKRQRQVLRYVFEGNGNREIATTLGISIKTVELHRACAMKKLRAESVIELVKMMTDFRHALEQGA
jgi:two-component system, LuxR family, response regulator FixJ